MKKKKDLLIVIDMQNVYLPGEPWACPTMPQITENICRILEADIAGQVAFTLFMPPQDPVGRWKDYNEENAEVNADAWMAELVDELKPYAKQYPVFEKSVYSSMKIAELSELAKQADRVVLTGVVAECCVLATLLEAIDEGHQVIYLTDCVSGQSEANEAAIRKIAESFMPVHTLVMDSREYLEEA